MKKNKTKYEKQVKPKLALITAWARDGLIDKDIAAKLGIGYSTLSLYRGQHPELEEALQLGKEAADVEVENALFRRAIGYAYTEVTRERIVDTGQKKRHGGESELTEREWEFAVKYFGGQCCYCGKQMDKLTKDHIKPLREGGALTRVNVIPCCGSCNSSKKDNEMESWYRTQGFFSEYRQQKIYDYVQFVQDIGNPSRLLSELVVTKEVTKEVQPDTTAQIFWLKNRKPVVWRDKHEMEHSGEMEVNNPFANLTTEELRALVKKGNG